MTDLTFYRGKNVLVTGHTGFKGTWLCRMLIDAGANVTGYALAPSSAKDLFETSGTEKLIHSEIGDIRDFSHLSRVFTDSKPEIVFHLAAQPIVRESYRDPVTTYETNVMGTVNVLECARKTDSVRSVVNVTTDKVYENREWVWGYRENETLDGYDPYSNSKSCSELVSRCYRRSFLKEKGTALSTVRAGNVIGGGDFAKDRIIPDCVRACMEKRSVTVRNPDSVRPFQFVCDPLAAYLLIGEKQEINPEFSGSYNIGPDEGDCLSVRDLVALMEEEMPSLSAVWEQTDGPHEAGILKLDTAKIKSVFGWHPKLTSEEAVRWTAEWYRTFLEKGDAGACMEQQVQKFLNI